MCVCEGGGVAERRREGSESCITQLEKDYVIALVKVLHVLCYVPHNVVLWEVARLLQPFTWIVSDNLVAKWEVYSSTSLPRWGKTIVNASYKD